MFIGIVSMNKDVVEEVNIDAINVKQASNILAEYVYTTYNREVPQGGLYYTGVVIDTTPLKTISNKNNVSVMNVCI
jgi:hypothetical protein